MADSGAGSGADTGCSSELKRFCTLTSLKGVSRAVRTQEGGLRAVWVGAVLLFLGVTMYNTYTLTEQYLGYPSSSKIEEQDLDYIKETAADIMVCNINPFSSTLLDVTLNLQRSYEKLITRWTTPQVRIRAIKDFVKLKLAFLEGESAFLVLDLYDVCVIQSTIFPACLLVYSSTAPLLHSSILHFFGVQSKFGRFVNMCLKIHLFPFILLKLLLKAQLISLCAK